MLSQLLSIRVTFRVNDPWSKETSPLWNQRSTKEVDNKMTPWDKKETNSPESSADNKPAESNNKDACKILFSSRTPPWEKQPVLDFDSVATKSVTHLNLTRPPVSTSDTVSKQSTTSSLRASERPSSSSPTLVQRANVSSAALGTLPDLSRCRSTENKGKSLPNKGEPNVKHLSEQHKSVRHSSELHKVTISHQNKHGARISSTSVPGKNPSSTTACSGSVSSTKAFPGKPVPVYSSSATIGSTLSNVSKIRSSSSVQGKSVLESSSGVTSKTKSGISVSNSHKRAESYSIPKVNQYSETTTTPTPTVAHTGINKAIGTTQRKSDSTAVRSTGTKTTSNQHSKTTTDVVSAGVSKPIGTMQKKPDSAAVRSAPSKTTSNQCSKPTTTTTDVDSTNVSKATGIMQKKPYSAAGISASSKTTSDSKTTTAAVVSADVSKDISTMQKKPGSAAVKSAPSKTTPNVPDVSGDLLSKILPTLKYSSPSHAHGSTSQTKSHSTDTGSTGHASTKSLKSLGTKHKPLAGQHDRSRHGSGTGSAGSSSPLHTEKSPSDRETVKSTSVSKTTLGIKGKNAVYDPRLNCVQLSSVKHSKTIEKQHIEEKQRSNSSRQEVSGANRNEKSTNVSSMKSSSSAPKPPAKIQQPVTRTPVEIQDPRKVTHSSKLSHGALTIKPISGFKIPKQKTVSDSENSVDELGDEKIKNSGVAKSPKKKKNKKDKDGLGGSADELNDEKMKNTGPRKSPKEKKKDKDEKVVSTANKNNPKGTSTEKKGTSSSKHGELKGHARDNMSCESVSTGNTFVEQTTITRQESTDKSSSVAKVSAAKNTKSTQR